jgi:hypothetical protein
MPERKPQRARIDGIVNAIKRGEYDDKLADLSDAIEDRRRDLREALLERIKEVYGVDYVVTKVQESAPIWTPGGSHPFVSSPGPNQPVDVDSAPESLPEPDDVPTDGDYESRSPLIGPTPQ